MEALIIGGIASLGYYLNKDKTQHQHKIKNVNKIVSENEKPSSDNIYSSRHLEKIHEKEFAYATQNYKNSEDPLKTGIVNGDTYRERQSNKYENSESLLQNDIKKEEVNSTTKFPLASNTVITNSSNLLDDEKIENYGTMSYNERRNNMPNPTFEIIPDNKNVIFKTVKNGKYGKGVNVYEHGHNNMEPFFSSSVKQNLNENANKTLLEKFTGSDVIYKHKKETKLFFKPEKNHEVFGQKITRNDDRYIPSISKNNILPFDQIKVGKGLNKSADELTTNVGFHDDYRPLGQGKYKSVDELRVKPKITYKGRSTGERHFVGTRTMPTTVSSNKTVDRYMTNFEPDSNNKDNVRYRALVPTKAQISKTTDLNKNGVVLKNLERNKYTEAISNFKGILKSGFGMQSSLVDSAKDTIKQQTENNTHKFTNAYGESKQHQVNPYDIAKTTIKEQFENNTHKFTNAYGESKQHQVNPYDIAKTTIKQQTQDNTHKFTNAYGESKQHQLNPYDDAKVTIKQQTQERTYEAPKGSSQSYGQQSNRYNYYNAEINALKEQTIHRRAPVSEGAKIGPESKQYNVDSKKIQYNIYNHTQHVEPTIQKVNTKNHIGNFTRQKQLYDQNINNDRIDPVFVQQFNENPYTQKLSSHIIPYNPKSVER